MTTPFPEPMTPAGSRADVMLGYLDYFRSVIVDKVRDLPVLQEYARHAGQLDVVRELIDGRTGEQAWW